MQTFLQLNACIQITNRIRYAGESNSQPQEPAAYRTAQASGYFLRGITTEV